MSIKIDPEFRDLIPPLSPDEFDQLEKSVVGQGILSPLLVWKEEGILVDGHNRHKICTEFKKPFPTKEISFDDREQVKRFIILNQLGRRNVTPKTAEVLIGKYYESMKMNQGAPVGNSNADKQSGNNCHVVSTAETVAKKTGVSERTVRLDAQLVRALKKLGISETDYMSGKIKRNKKDIINEAFPPKPKPRSRPAASEVIDAEVIESDAAEPETLVVDGTKDKASPKTRSGAQRLTNDEILDDYLMSELARIGPEWAKVDKAFIEKRRAEARSGDQTDTIKNLIYQLWLLAPTVRTHILTGIINHQPIKP